jgi:hypothetical protein
MNGCKNIKKRIDEADKPNLLPFDVSEHIGQCADCQRFANERSSLRELVAGGSRVTAPINFDAVLKARLAEVNVRRSFWWLGSPGLLRLGAATAGVAVMVFAAQYAGVFSEKAVGPSNVNLAAEVAPSLAPKPVDRQPDMRESSVVLGVVAGSGRPYQGYNKRGRRGDIPVASDVHAAFMTAEDGGVVLVRGRNGDMDVQMPTVSVGAQPLLYVSAGQRTTRSVGTSF